MSKTRNILLGVTGSIAAYKAADLVRLLLKADFEVKVLMTKNAQQFVHANTFSALSRHPVYTDLFDNDVMLHIELAKWADLVLIAPATASTMSRIANGNCEDLLSTICAATIAPLIIAPAMNQAMWSNWAVQDNLKKLRANGVQILEPDSGEQACGDIGPGRLLDNQEILAEILNLTEINRCFKNKKILITAGPTREAIDPVRFISNHSSGKMGYALAEAAKKMGAQVTLISGPTALKASHVDNLLAVETAQEMLEAVLKNVEQADIFISAAAVADYKPKIPSIHKIKKTAAELVLELEKTPDILSTISSKKKKPMLIGFAAETENSESNAIKKLIDKKLDAIILNEIKEGHYPFYAESNEVILIDRNHNKMIFPRTDKEDLAFQLMKGIAKMLPELLAPRGIEVLLT